MSNPSNYSYIPFQEVDTDSQNLRATVFRYLRNWPWFVASLVVALAGAYVYLLYQQPVYRSQASLLIKDEKKGIDQESILKELEISGPKKTVENEIEILKSFTLMEKVVNKLDLDVRYYTETSFGKRDLYAARPFRFVVEAASPALYKDELRLTFPTINTVQINGKTYPVNRPLITPYGRIRVDGLKGLKPTTEPVIVQVLTRTDAVNGYVNALKAEPTSKASTVIVLSLEDAVPERGEAILNGLIDEYNQAAIADKNQIAGNTLKFIEDRLSLISGDLAVVEKDVEHYKSSQGITDLSTQAQSFLQTLQTNDAQLNETTLQLGALKDVERYVQQQSDQKGMAPATLGLNDPVLLGLVSKLSELELQREQMARTTSEQNPMLQTLDSQIKSTKTSIQANVQNMKAMLTTTQKQLQANNVTLEGQIRTIPGKERNLLEISRQQAIKSNLYTYLLQKREETAVSFASTISDSRTVDKARTAAEPVKPVQRTIFLIFALVGLLIPVGVMAGKDMLSNRVMRRTDVEEGTQVPILGEIVKSKKLEPIVISGRKQSIIAEQIRTLRTNLQFLRTDPKGSQVLLFTSSISGEGKSFISLNLGASLALVNRPTVILEMDLRKPKLHKNLNIFPGQGLSNYLIGEATVDEILQPVPGNENYFIITSGPIPPNPAELLSGPKLPELIDELKKRFDYVLIDSPPIGLVTDAQVIAPLADATLYVVRHDHTPKNFIKQLDTWNREHRFNKLNVILNAVGEGEAYYYSYSYGAYYGEGKDKRLTRPS
ncbi:GumC family protein [Arsenicibacter rosenii]|uniref:Capsular biosynthesis protein n=1 Tax=Arsenicibacter rosenii TaxID=1750698 RepID=A0A1S2VJ71_9BACT|nr:tyrosine-protein kinase [Arsenicibacter rosenii]OIN58804.1 capsular biosynthesis protein [Arsenicibacter rosenii]